MADSDKGGAKSTQKDFLEFYAKRLSEAELAVEREVYGLNAGIVSYTTPAQALELARAVSLTAGMRLLEVGAGSGWPGVMLAAETRCEAVLTDVPVAGVHTAARRAAKQGIRPAVAGIAAAGSHLPFRRASFDAVIHCDVLC